MQTLLELIILSDMEYHGYISDICKVSKKTKSDTYNRLKKLPKYGGVQIMKESFGDEVYVIISNENLITYIEGCKELITKLNRR